MEPVRVAGLSLVVGSPAWPARAELGDECRAVQQLLRAPPGDVEALPVERSAGQCRVPVPRRFDVGLAGFTAVDPHPHILTAAGPPSGASGNCRAA
ncbi:hypothetical protein ABZV68_22835 [Streptomyces clavifer]|uniref:hypothetical protein n=1 Tax=Streptomyces clavifer TaxID=68188 RepID=UPI0033A35A5E